MVTNKKKQQFLPYSFVQVNNANKAVFTREKF